MKPIKLFTALALAMVVLFTGCKKDDFVEVAGVCPLVILTSPVNLATSVPLDKIITATFNEKMNPATVIPSSFALQSAKKSSEDVKGIFSYDQTSNTISFVPEAQLEANTTYSGTVKSGVKDLSGNALQVDYVWIFSTGLIINPTVISTDPLNLATGVVLNKTVTAKFSEAMNGASFTTTSFIVKDGLNPVAGAVSYTGTTASFNPTADLLPGKLYTATITTGATNVAGTPLLNNYVWTFTALSAAPTVILTDPLSLAKGVVLNKTLTATFSEAMKAANFTTTSFTLMEGVNQVFGAVSYAGTTATFNPTNDLLPGKLYTATITTAVQSVSGKAMAHEYVWTFTSFSPAPTVILTDPLDLATGVFLNTTVTATFSEAMKAANFTTTSFTLMENGNLVDADISYAGLMASLNPKNDLLPGKVYTATITTAVQTLSGTAMATNKTWSFTTLSIIPTVPTVIQTDPSSSETGVVLNKNITADFSEVMNGTTITTLTFTLTDGVNPVLGGVSYAGTTATFNPDDDLVAGKEYTATITTGVESAGGIALATDYIWSFEALVVPPTVSSTNPINLETGVALDKVISADFSEIMDLTTIDELTFTLTDGGVPVLGLVEYAGTTATFTPSAPLSSSIVYTATITTGAKNLSGTPLAIDKVWSFTTRAPLGPGIVNLRSAANFVILSTAGISTTGVTSITGDIGVSPVTSTAITGFGQIMDVSNEFSTSTLVNGKIYAPDYTEPTPTILTAAISDMETALTEAMGMTLSVITELGAGDISGMTLVPGLYKWGTGLNISGVGVTLSGGPDDTWVFQISSDFVVNGSIVLAGGAQAKNIFWVTETQALLASTVDFSGNIIAGTLIDLKTGAKVTGRLLSHTAVTLDAAIVVKP